MTNSIEIKWKSEIEFGSCRVMVHVWMNDCVYKIAKTNWMKPKFNKKQYYVSSSKREKGRTFANECVYVCVCGYKSWRVLFEMNLSIGTRRICVIAFIRFLLVSPAARKNKHCITCLAYHQNNGPPNSTWKEIEIEIKLESERQIETREIYVCLSIK